MIPIPSRVSQALRREESRLRRAQVHEGREHVLTGEKDEPDRDCRAYSHVLQAAIKEWNSRLGWAPKDLRNCVITLGKIEFFDSSLLEQYIGHAPRGVSDVSYLSCLASSRTHSGEQEVALERLKDIFQRGVVDHVEKVSSATTSADSHRNRALGTIQRNHSRSLSRLEPSLISSLCWCSSVGRAPDL